MYQAIIPQVVSIIRVVARPLAQALSTWIGVSYADSLVRDGLGITPSTNAILEETAEQPNATEEQVRATLYISFLLKAIGVSFLLYYIYGAVRKLIKR